jgi:hypothetical protein
MEEDALCWMTRPSMIYRIMTAIPMNTKEMEEAMEPRPFHLLREHGVAGLILAGQQHMQAVGLQRVLQQGLHGVELRIRSESDGKGVGAAVFAGEARQRGIGQEGEAEGALIPASVAGVGIA